MYKLMYKLMCVNFFLVIHAYVCNNTSIDMCNITNGCYIVNITTCRYDKSTPINCRTHYYGCQSYGDFCAFNLGDNYERLFQCNNKGFPCKFNRKTKECSMSTKRPTNKYVEKETCFNSCIPWMKNGVCDDGGKGSQTNLCMYGTDCEDCGKRQF